MNYTIPAVHNILTDNTCPDGNQFVWTYFGECVKTDKELAAFIIGLSSIGFWLVAQAPQLFMNFRNGNADSLAPAFLLQWLLGDLTNLVGAVMTHQLKTQIFNAYYFVMIDMVMILQFLYYKLKRKRKRLSSYSGSRDSMLGCCSLILCSLYGALVYVDAASKNQNSIGSAQTIHLGGNGITIQSVLTNSTNPMSDPAEPFFKDNSEYYGYLIGIASATLYLLSRIPQIVKNQKRKSTGGLSFKMFTLALLANLTYSLGIFLTSTDHTFLLKKMPWIVGSLGTMFFDTTIFFQFFWYKDSTQVYIDERRQNHDLNRGNRSVEDAAPLLDDLDSDSNLSYDDDSEDHTPISPLMYPAAQKTNYYYISRSE